MDIDHVANLFVFLKTSTISSPSRTHTFDASHQVVIVRYALKPFSFRHRQRSTLIVVDWTCVFSSRPGSCYQGHGSSIRIDPSRMAFLLQRFLLGPYKSPHLGSQNALADQQMHSRRKCYWSVQSLHSKSYVHVQDPRCPWWCIVVFHLHSLFPLSCLVVVTSR